MGHEQPKLCLLSPLVFPHLFPSIDYPGTTSFDQEATKQPCLVTRDFQRLASRVQNFIDAKAGHTE